MRPNTMLKILPAILASITLAIRVPSVASAASGGGHGGGGGGHGGGGGFQRGGAGLHGGGAHGYFGGGALRGSRHYFGSNGYYGGRGHYGYGGRGYRGWWGGVGLGLYVPVLPWYYDTFWWGDVPYYYADHSYYVWDDQVGEFQAVDPPAGLRATNDESAAPADSAASASELFAYPKGGQSETQQARDREECRQWALAQPTADPPSASGSAGNDAPATTQSHLRAEAACLEGRNYTVR